MNFIVTDRETILKGIRMEVPYIVVSIRSPGVPEPRILQPGHCRSIHYEVFHDAEPCEMLALPDDIKLMTPEQARKIAEFFNEHRPHIKAVVVHCEIGWSRSPATAAALAKHCGQDDSLYFEQYDPNRHVHKLMSEALSQLSPAPKDLLAGYTPPTPARRRR